MHHILQMYQVYTKCTPLMSVTTSSFSSKMRNIYTDLHDLMKSGRVNICPAPGGENLCHDAESLMMSTVIVAVCSIHLIRASSAVDWSTSVLLAHHQGCVQHCVPSID